MNTLRLEMSVIVFLLSGDPNSLKSVKKSNSTGRGLVIIRAIFMDSRRRADLYVAGVYLLVGVSELFALPSLYIGESDAVKPWLDSHAKQKDFWTHAVVFTSKDTNLNKAHVQRLEAWLVHPASRAMRCIVQNGSCPVAPSLSEAEEASAEKFFDDLLLGLLILGYCQFEDSATAASNAGHAGSFSWHLTAKGIAATDVDTPTGFVVRRSSRAVIGDEITPSMLVYIPHAKDRCDDLVRQGSLVEDGNEYLCFQDYVCGSPSTVASVVMGRNVNGRVDWKAANGQSLKQLQEFATFSQ